MISKGSAGFLFSLAIVLASCGYEGRNFEAVGSNHDSLRRRINETFVGAVPFEDYTDSLLFFLYAVHRISPDKILLGQSTCVDDVLNTEVGDLSTADSQKQSDGALFYKTLEGRDDMPSFKKKIPDEDEIWALVNFMRTLKAK